MKHQIPTVLYRGDSDPKGIRLLRKTVHFGQVHTNLISGGYSSDLVKYGTLELVVKHVDTGWPTTHFLSFSESVERAHEFGENNLPKPDQFMEYYGQENEWDYVLIEIQTNQLNCIPLGNGVFTCQFPSSLKTFNQNKVFLIDVITFLSQFEGASHAKENASRNKEWLVYPANPINLGNHQSGNSAILDIGTIGTVQKYISTGKYISGIS